MPATDMQVVGISVVGILVAGVPVVVVSSQS